MYVSIYALPKLDIIIFTSNKKIKKGVKTEI